MVVAAFNREEALLGAFLVIVQLHRLIVYSTTANSMMISPPPPRLHLRPTSCRCYRSPAPASHFNYWSLASNFDIDTELTDKYTIYGWANEPYTLFQLICHAWWGTGRYFQKSDTDKHHLLIMCRNIDVKIDEPYCNNSNRAMAARLTVGKIGSSIVT